MTDIQLIVGMSLLAGALALDETALLQVMVSQPLVAGSLAGLVSGNPALGITVGATLQLVWIGILPVGSAPFPDGAVAGVAAVGVSVLLTRAGVGYGAAAATGILTGVVAGSAGQPVIGLVRRMNGAYADIARRRAEDGDARGVGSAVALGLLTRYVAGAVMAMLFIAVGGVLARPVATALASSTHTPFPTLLWAAPIACAAVAVAGRGVLDRVLVIAGFAAGLALASGF